MMNREMELNMNELDHVNGGRFFCTGNEYTDAKQEVSACCNEGASTEYCRDESIFESVCIFYMGLGIGYLFG